MIIHKRCTVCHEDIETGAAERRGNCVLTLHTKRAAFVLTFGCPECAVEVAIGAVEF